MPRRFAVALAFATLCITAVLGGAVLSGAVLGGAVLSGCSRDPRIDPNRTTIAVVPKGTTHEFWKSIHAGAVKAGRELDVDIVWKGPLKEDDREAQISVVENMVRLGVKGIVLAPLDETALQGPVAACVKAKVPVVVIDSGLKGKAHSSFIATNNEKGGRMAGEYLAKLLKGRGRVVMLRYEEGSASTEAREKGFMAAMRRFPRIRVVSANQYGGATTETAYRASENLLAPLKEKGKLAIDGIFTCNESTTFGMLRALQDGGFAGKVKFVGFDSSIKLVEALRAGTINGLILQNPFQMGYLGVKTMVAKLKKKPVKAKIDTGETLVTTANMDDPKIKDLLSPNLSEWLR